MTRYKRVLVKLSGRAMAGAGDWGISQHALEHIARELLSVKQLGVQVAVVVGGGNIFRGNVAEAWGIDRAEADNIGMLGTVVNSLFLRGVLSAHQEVGVRVMTALPMETFAEPYIRLRAIRHLERDLLVIFACGIGQPFVTTDYPAVQRAAEIHADVVLAAKHGVNGVYDADPNRFPAARRYATLSYDDALQSNLQVMDQSAILLARDFGIPLHVFDFDEPGVMRRICEGEMPGTYIAPETSLRFAS